MAEQSFQERTEPATAKRREDARQKGQVAKSMELNSAIGLVFVTAFLTRRAMTKYLADIAWETEVWVAEAPSHIIHFNGERFLGPYE